MQAILNRAAPQFSSSQQTPPHQHPPHPNGSGGSPPQQQPMARMLQHPQPIHTAGLQGTMAAPSQQHPQQWQQPQQAQHQTGVVPYPPAVSVLSPLGSPTAQAFPAPSARSESAQPPSSSAFRPSMPAVTPSAPFSPPPVNAQYAATQAAQIHSFPTPAQMQMQAQAQAQTQAQSQTPPSAAPAASSVSSNSAARSGDSDAAPTAFSSSNGIAAAAVAGGVSGVAGSSTFQDAPLDVDAAYDPHDPTVAATPEYLSSYSVPNQMDVARASPLPMGVLFSPAVHLHPAPPRFQKPLQECRVCKASVNLYCRMVAAAPGLASPKWICALCQASQPFVSEIGQFVQAQQISRGASSGGGGGGASPKFTTPVELAYKVVESVWPASRGAAILPPTVLPASASPRAGFAPSHPRGTGQGLNYLFVIDRNLSKSSMAALKSSLVQAVRELPPDAGLALLSFHNTVAIYDLTQKGVAACEVFSGESSPALEDLEAHFGTAGVQLPRVKECAEVFGECLDAMEQGCSSQAGQERVMAPRALGAAAEWVLALVQAGREVDDAAASAALSSSSPARSPSVPAFSFAHTFLLTSGAPDFGPGATTLQSASAENDAAESFYTELGSRMRQAHVQVEVMCQGGSHFSIPIVRKLCEPTGGGVYMHNSFGIESLAGAATTTAAAASAVTSGSAGAGAGASAALLGENLFLADLRSILFRSLGYAGEVWIHLSSGVRITRVIGGVAQLSEESFSPLPDEANQGDFEASAAADKEAAGRVRHLRLSLSSLRPDHTISLYYTLTDDLPADYIFLQFVTQWRDWNHQLVRRVSTRRLRTTGNPALFVRSIDIKVAAMLAVKRIVTKTMDSAASLEASAQQAQEDIDDLVRDSCVHFGRSRPAQDLGGVPVYELPLELNILPLLLFHVRRGPMLGLIVQHADDLAILRSTFLKASRTDALRMCMPTLMSFNTRGALEDLPLETLALQSNRILFLDHHTQILVSGSKTSADRAEQEQRSKAGERVRVCPGMCAHSLLGVFCVPSFPPLSSTLLSDLVRFACLLGCLRILSWRLFRPRRRRPSLPFASQRDSIVQRR